MAGRFNLKLRAHFFNKIDPNRPFAAKFRCNAAVTEAIVADTGSGSRTLK
jgi:hypothetical protein